MNSTRHSRWWAGLLIGAVVLIVTTATLANTDDEKSGMKRRQQGILTGMPFMTHVSARAYVDDAGRRMYFAKPPARIVSLAPSITEMLFAMEAGEQLVGVTDFCDYPPEALKKPKVGYSNPNLESLVALQPDLVVAPNDFLKPDVIVRLEQLNIPVFILADKNVEGIFVHIQTLGRIVGRSPKADTVAMQLRQQVAAIQRRIQGTTPVRVLYVLNSQPLITVGPGSFIDQLIGMAGGINIAAKSAAPYPRLSLEAVLQEDPEVLVFPVGKAEGISESEQQAWLQWSTMTAVKQGRLHQISADWLNRPGPRIAQGLESLAVILHPDSITSSQVGR
ncbi:MAG TPA: cobalamin-binding protein [Nitrospiraceae bacterium]|nr:cobalamin-binding protein [Nitrospiraceae bacterium]